MLADHSLMQAEDEETARRTFERLRPIIKLPFAAPIPSAIKAMLSIERRIVDEVRMPSRLLPTHSSNNSHTHTRRCAHCARNSRSQPQ
ncbi:hypothetical protein PPMP20_18645 [Paraburkholderia phymatum]|uniref:hypothetical protein n=1 Tax=Paraburkholderia phymatum TaxID=148447 RepID=UPI0002E3BD12|nr:hypothetical protein [Paraburkholderia phymatum]